MRRRALTYRSIDQSMCRLDAPTTSASYPPPPFDRVDRVADRACGGMGGVDGAVVCGSEAGSIDSDRRCCRRIAGRPTPWVMDAACWSWHPGGVVRLGISIGASIPGPRRPRTVRSSQASIGQGGGRPWGEWLGPWAWGAWVKRSVQRPRGVQQSGGRRHAWRT